MRQAAVVGDGKEHTAGTQRLLHMFPHDVVWFPAGSLSHTYISPADLYLRSLEKRLSCCKTAGEVLMGMAQVTCGSPSFQLRKHLLCENRAGCIALFGDARDFNTVQSNSCDHCNSLIQAASTEHFRPGKASVKSQEMRLKITDDV